MSLNIFKVSTSFDFLMRLPYLWGYKYLSYLTPTSMVAVIKGLNGFERDNHPVKR